MNVEGIKMNIFQVKTMPHEHQRIREFIDDKFICIGWPGIGNLKQADKDEIRNILKKSYNVSGHKLGNYLGQVNTFVNVMKKDDIVIIRERSYAHIGIVGDYEYFQQYDNQQDGMCHRRCVEWVNRILITDLDSSIQRLVSNRNTICQYPDTIEKSGLTQYLSKTISINPQPATKLDNLFHDALAILEEELKSSDPDRRLKAATELLRLKNNL